LESEVMDGSRHGACCVRNIATAIGRFVTSSLTKLSLCTAAEKCSTR